MATVVVETSLQIKSFAKIFAIIFFNYNFKYLKNLKKNPKKSEPRQFDPTVPSFDFESLKSF